jgi:hypothetical protein
MVTLGRLLTTMAAFCHLGMVVGRSHRHRASAERGKRREQHRNGKQYREEWPKTHARAYGLDLADLQSA